MAPHSVAVALKVDIANVYLFGTLARVKPFRRRPRQRFLARGQRLWNTVVFGRHWVAPRGGWPIVPEQGLCSTSPSWVFAATLVSTTSRPTPMK